MGRLQLTILIIGFIVLVPLRAEDAQSQESELLGLPSVHSLTLQLSLSDDQAKKVAAIYEQYEDKAQEVEKTGDENLKARVRRDIVVLIKGVCTSDQRELLDQIVAAVE